MFCKKESISYWGVLVCGLLMSHWGIAQNLVPNPSFEEYKQLPCKVISLPQKFNEIIKYWTVPTYGTADVFNTTIDPTCWAYPFGDSYFDMQVGKAYIGVQAPHTGNSMAGIAVYVPSSNYREYLQVRLTTPLLVGQSYKVSFWVAHASAVHFATNQLGFAMVKDSVHVHHTNILPIRPQFVSQEVVRTKFLEWQQLSAVIVVQEAAEYLIIGNFAANHRTIVEWIEHPLHESKEPYLRQSAYYFIDDVVVEEYMEDEFAGFRQRKRIQLDSTLAPIK